MNASVKLLKVEAAAICCCLHYYTCWILKKEKDSVYNFTKIYSLTLFPIITVRVVAILVSSQHYAYYKG